jgi:hypothetical protein
VDDLEGAAIKLRQFIDRVRTASYGYAGFFDAVKVRSEELDTALPVRSVAAEPGR